MFNNKQQKSHQQTASEMLARLRAQSQIAKLRRRQKEQQILGAPQRLANVVNSVSKTSNNLQSIGDVLNKTPYSSLNSLGNTSTTLAQKLSDFNNSSGLSQLGEGLNTLGKGAGVIGKGYNTYKDLQKGDYLGAGINTADTGYSAYQLGSQLGQKAGQQAAQQIAQQAAQQGAEKLAEQGAEKGLESGAQVAGEQVANKAWIIGAIIDAMKNAKDALIDTPNRNAKGLTNDELQKSLLHNSISGQNNFGNNISALSGNYQAQDVDNDIQSYTEEQKKSKADDATTQENMRKGLALEATREKDEQLLDNGMNKAGLGSDLNLLKWINKGVNKTHDFIPILKLYDMFTSAQNEAMNKAIEEGNRSSRISQEEFAKEHQMFENSAMENLSNAVQENAFDNSNSQSNEANAIIDQVARQQEKENELPNTEYISNLIDKYRTDGTENQTLDNTIPVVDENKETNPIAEYQDFLKGEGYSDDVINGIPQGLNSGYQAIDDWIQQYNQGAGKDNPIRIPQTEEDIALAREGKFNIPTPQVEQPTQEIVPTEEQQKEELKNTLLAGYRDNLENSFSTDNLKSDPDKTWQYKLGEALGTGQRFLSNPYVQGAIATGIARANGRSFGNSLLTGVNWAQNKAKSDAYERLINPEKKAPSLLGGYGSKDYQAKTEGERRQVQNIMDAISAQQNQKKLEGQLEKWQVDMYKTLWEIEHGDKKFDLDKAYKEFEMKDKAERTAIEKAYKEGKLKVDQQNANTNNFKANTDANYKSGMLGVAKQNANTNSFKANTDANYKSGMLGVAKQKAATDANYKKEMIGVNKQNATTNANKANSYAKSVDLKQQELDWKKKQAIAKGMTVMEAPDGSRAIVPKEFVNKYLMKGARVVK